MKNIEKEIIKNILNSKIEEEYNNASEKYNNLNESKVIDKYIENKINGIVKAMESDGYELPNGRKVKFDYIGVRVDNRKHNIGDVLEFDSVEDGIKGKKSDSFSGVCVFDITDNVGKSGLKNIVNDLWKRYSNKELGGANVYMDLYLVGSNQRKTADELEKDLVREMGDEIDELYKNRSGKYFNKKEARFFKPMVLWKLDEQVNDDKYMSKYVSKRLNAFDDSPDSVDYTSNIERNADKIDDEFSKCIIGITKRIEEADKEEEENLRFLLNRINQMYEVEIEEIKSIGKLKELKNKIERTVTYMKNKEYKEYKNLENVLNYIDFIVENYRKEFKK